MKHEELTKRIIACAMKVHTELGNGFQEVIYQRALAIELELADLSFEREKVMNIFYRDREIGTRRADFFIEDKIMLKLKAVISLEDAHLAQAMNYLEAYKMEIGLLINFGAKRMEFKRVHNNKLINKVCTPGQALYPQTPQACLPKLESEGMAAENLPEGTARPEQAKRVEGLTKD